MLNNKSPGNDDLIKEYFEKFWSEAREHFHHVFYTLLVKKNSVPHKEKQL